VIFLLAIPLLLFPAAASANAGIPMLALAWPAYWIALVPVIVFEGIMARKIIGLEWGKSFKASTVANLVSTFLGIPITWLLLFLVEMAIAYSAHYMEMSGDLSAIVLFPFMAAWLPPVEDVCQVYAAFVVLAVPFCLVSIYIEAQVAKRVLATVELPILYKWARRSNVLSYFAIITLSALYPLVL
jgi:hypothetical protein